MYNPTRMYPVKTPKFIQHFFPNLVWRIPSSGKKLYLTFDDGPVPEITPWVLDQLRTYNAKATFFCVGENVSSYPELFARLMMEGHAVGNHTFNHLNGWMTPPDEYFSNITQCNYWVESTLFRPPYGKLLPSQSTTIQKDFTIILWDVLSADFDTRKTGFQCYQNVVNYAKPGSIVVFHDSYKAAERLTYALPKVLEHFHALGYSFEAITPEVLPILTIPSKSPKREKAL